MRVVTVVGARPQFIKAAPVSAALRVNHEEVLVHTGQHYDHELSELLFRQLEIPEPDYNLEVGSGQHGSQTGLALARVEAVLLERRPDVVLVYGDTNSTLAGALAAAKLRIPVAHVEAGLRSFNRGMPEEVNRVVTDHLSDLLLAPTAAAIANLRQEGIVNGVHWVGDVMYDCAVRWLPEARRRFGQLAEQLEISAGHYCLVTIHRAENTDNPRRLRSILDALIESGERVVLPVHPRTNALFNEPDLAARLKSAPQVLLMPPVGYLEMLALEAHARFIVTDSGGVQKEGYFVGTPVITVRDQTEWVETVEAGWNMLVGADRRAIVDALSKSDRQRRSITDYGDGQAAVRIADLIGGLA